MKRFRLDGRDPATANGRSSKRQPPGSSRRLVLSTAPSVDALRSAGFRGARARDFEDFVTEDRCRTTSALPLPDPSFRERLRRRLWRIQVLTRQDGGRIRH